MIRSIQIVRGKGTDPYANLALEKTLAKTVPEGCCILYLWQNQNTVVIGRNQNAWKECRTRELAKDGGVLARRLSGGGAVYHDLGNLNFTFCVKREDYDLERQQRVILGACRILGIEAALSGRNDLLAEGKKFSGNSFYLHSDGCFHNGTLLISVDPQKLSRYLSPSKAKIESKGVASVRSRVVNLSELNPAVTVPAMSDAMERAFAAVYGLTPEILDRDSFDPALLERERQKFASYDWNYGKSLPFDFSMERKFLWGEITVQTEVREGRCRQVAVYTDAMDFSFAEPLAAALENCQFTEEAMCRAVAQCEACASVAEDICALIKAQTL